MPEVPTLAKLVACVSCHMVKLIHKQAHQMKCPHCNDFKDYIVILDGLNVTIPVPSLEWPE